MRIRQKQHKKSQRCLHPKRKQHRTVGVKLAGAKWAVEQPNAITESWREIHANPNLQ
ncbi:hypothetical protein [Catenovulum maritimum]|uniref:hypothetical protein n=1 Tax=Catenovulum maritimum TaxID=1513271 RepID=UPI0012B5DAA4|nr:hypothetical protein [Catenovulum maritimum]